MQEDFDNEEEGEYFVSEAAEFWVNGKKLQQPNTSNALDYKLGGCSRFRLVTPMTMKARVGNKTCTILQVIDNATVH